LLRLLAPPPNAPRLEDRAEIDRLYRRYRATAIVGLTLTYGFYYTCRLGLSVVKKPLIDSGVFTAEELGLIGAGFFWAYGAGKLINGFMADRVSIRAFIPLGLAISALVNLAFGINELVIAAVVLWAINGWFQGFGAPASVVGLTRWFAPSERGTMYGIWSTAHSVGEGITFGATSALVAATAWQAAFVGPGLLCLVVAAVAYAALRDRPGAVGLPPIAEYKGEQAPGGGASTGHAQLEVLRNPAIWVIGLASASMYVSRYAINNWGVLYLQEEHGLGLAAAGGLLGINTIAAIGGCAAYGWISDRFFAARRPPLTLIFGVVEIASLLMIFYGPTGNRAVLIAGLVLYGFTLSGLLAVLGGLFAVDLVGRKAVGAAMGVVGVFSYLGAGAQEIISGTLVGRDSIAFDFVLIGQVRVYDFSVAALFWIGASVVSAILAATLWNVRARPT
jgi:OPA family sugar phosphate sensor protein UhpC-like MFS transporter